MAAEHTFGHDDVGSNLVQADQPQPQQLLHHLADT